MNTLKKILYPPTIFILALIEKLLHSSRWIRGCWFDVQPKNSFCVNSRGPIQYVMHTNDKVIAKAVYRTGIFDSEKVLEALKLIPDANARKILVDVGANIGTIAIDALSNNLFDRAIAYEPVPANFRLLKVNILLNGFEEKSVLHNLAVGAEDNKVLPLELSGDNLGDHRVQFSKAGGKDNEDKRKTIEINSITLDSSLESEAADRLFIWIDTQGFEAFVLAGASNLIHQRTPVVIEFWPYGISRSNSYELLKESLLKFSFYIDLSSTDKERVKLSSESIDTLANKLGWEGDATDILLLAD